MSESGNKSFVKGAAILGAAGLVVKILGAVFRIPLGNMVSESSMAYYQPAYYIYTFFIVIATSGLPVAISRMVSARTVVQDYKGAHHAFRVARNLMLAVGAVSFVILFFGAGPLSSLMHAPNARFPLMVIAPAILLVPLMSSYRGYFQGTQNMKPTAVSQVVEQLFRVVFGLGLAYFLYNSSEDFMAWAGDNPTTASDVKGAMGAVSGATIGSLAGLGIILFIYLASRKAIYHRMRLHPDTVEESSSDLIKQILIIAVPITIGAAVMPIMNMVEVPIINSRLLDCGFSTEEADVLYGTLSGYVTSLINLPQAVTMAIGVSLVPMITAVYTTRDRESLAYNAILGGRLAMLIGAPCAVGLAVLAKPIMLLLYPAKPQVAESSASCLIILGIGVIFLALVQTMTAILQGVSRQMIPVRNLAIVIVIKIILTYILVGIPELNILGAALATTIAYFVAAVLDILSAQKYTGVIFPAGLTYLRPMAASLVMGGAAWGVHRVLMLLSDSLKWNAVATLLAILVAVAVYAVMLFVTRSLTRDDLEHLPKGDKLAALYDRILG